MGWRERDGEVAPAPSGEGGAAASGTGATLSFRPSIDQEVAQFLLALALGHGDDLITRADNRLSGGDDQIASAQDRGEVDVGRELDPLDRLIDHR